eukprot:scaffold120134_cov19-Prasinocladus_malaysianus.AAC.1
MFRVSTFDFRHLGFTPPACEWLSVRTYGSDKSSTNTSTRHTLLADYYSMRTRFADPSRSTDYGSTV